MIPYDTYVFRLRGLVMVIFVAAQAPELVSRDLRSHVLPLYFCRPVRRLDYPLAKYAALHRGLPGHGRDPAAAAVPRHRRERQRYLGHLEPDQGVHPRPAHRGAVGGAAGRDRAGPGLAHRPPRVRDGRDRHLLLPHLDAGLHPDRGLGRPGGPGGQAAPLAARLAGLVSPITVLDGVRRWLGGTSFGPVPLPGSAGVLYGAMFLLLLAASLGGLAARYRKAGLA